MIPAAQRSFAVVGVSCSITSSPNLSIFWENALGRAYFSDATPIVENTTEIVVNNLAELSDELNIGLRKSSVWLCAQSKKITQSDFASSTSLNINFTETSIIETMRLAMMQLQSELIDIAIIGLVEDGIHSSMPGFAAVAFTRANTALEAGFRIYATFNGHFGQANESISSVIRDVHESAAIDVQAIKLMETNIGPSSNYWSQINNAYTASRKTNCAVDKMDPALAEYPQISFLTSFIKTVLCVYQRILPPANLKTEHNEQVSFPFYVNVQTRPWIHPAYLKDSNGKRAGAFCFVDNHNNFAYCLFQEPEFSESGEDLSFWKRWDTELSIIDAGSPEELLNQIQWLEHYLLLNQNIVLKDLAFTLNAQRQNLNYQRCARLAIVSSSVKELLVKLKIAATEISTYPYESFEGNNNNTPGIYYVSVVPEGEKIAFVLPGLGAAYPNMLADFCFHFPEVRWVFDFVDRLALLACEKNLPSKLIFPELVIGTDNTLSVAALAAIDSAVTIVLLAEWALFALFEKLAIKPDAFIGCSTGEFAAITMGGAIEIVSAASTFYILSTNVAKSIPKDKLLELSSIKVAALFDELSSYIDALDEPVYLTADLAPKHLIITGTRASIAKLINILRLQDIDVQMLPMAIPYHTPLVEGVIKIDQDEIRDLSIQSLQTDAWSCSTASKYPVNSEGIRQITTDLFTKPIRLRQTIEDAYNNGLHNFLEVGPRGTLTGLIKETLKGKPHTSLAADVPNNNSINHLHHLLAKLSCCGISMDLDYLYRRRTPKYLNEFVLQSESNNEYKADGYELFQQLPSTNVITNYFESLQSFHNQLISVQESVMSEYLLHSYGNNDLIGSENPEFAFLNNSTIDIQKEEVVIHKHFGLATDLYLLDHAIGGAVSFDAQAEQRVCLMPLMVAIELMCDAAQMLIPDMIVCRIESVRAFRRIRVDANGLDLVIRAKSIDDLRIGVEINLSETHLDDFQDQETEQKNYYPLMSCEVVFDVSRSQAPEIKNFFVPNIRKPRTNDNNLYGSGSMFHGPRMQSVKKLNCVGEKFIEGAVVLRDLHDWFDFSSNNNKSLIDPLLLDNASQFVLYYLYEDSIAAAALLPFYIESIELFDYPSIEGDMVSVQAKLLSVTDKGTQADLNVVTDKGQLAVRINNINSRLIVLPHVWQRFIDDPATHTIGEPFTDQIGQNCVAFMVQNINMPSDDGVLEWCSDYVLSYRERQAWQKMNVSAKRKREWLMGRIAAKEAVREFWKNDTTLLLADIEIIYGENGAPYAVAPGITETRISISHITDVAVAVASDISIGIDVETIQTRESDFDEVAFTENERALLQTKASDQKAITSTCFWCAKEAFAKAHNISLLENLQAIEIAKSNDDASELVVQHNGRQQVVTQLIKTFKIDNFIVALTFNETLVKAQ